MTGLEKLDRIKVLMEVWVGIVETFPLPMLIFREGILVQSAGPVEALLGRTPMDLDSRSREELVEDEHLHDQNDSSPAEKGSVIFKHATVGRRVAPASIMNFESEDSTYEVIMVLAGVRAITSAKGAIGGARRDPFIGV